MTRKRIGYVIVWTADPIEFIDLVWILSRFINDVSFLLIALLLPDFERNYVKSNYVRRCICIFKLVKINEIKSWQIGYGSTMKITNDWWLDKMYLRHCISTRESIAESNHHADFSSLLKLRQSKYRISRIYSFVANLERACINSFRKLSAGSRSNRKRKLLFHLWPDKYFTGRLNMLIALLLPVFFSRPASSE